MKKVPTCIYCEHSFGAWNGLQTRAKKDRCVMSPLVVESFASRRTAYPLRLTTPDGPATSNLQDAVMAWHTPFQTRAPASAPERRFVQLTRFRKQDGLIAKHRIPLDLSSVVPQLPLFPGPVTRECQWVEYGIHPAVKSGITEHSSSALVHGTRTTCHTVACCCTVLVKTLIPSKCFRERTCGLHACCLFSWGFLPPLSCPCA